MKHFRMILLFCCLFFSLGAAENLLTNLMAGKIVLHVYLTPPSPAQEIDFVLEYDASYVESALSA